MIVQRTGHTLGKLPRLRRHHLCGKTGQGTQHALLCAALAHGFVRQCRKERGKSRLVSRKYCHLRIHSNNRTEDKRNAGLPQPINGSARGITICAVQPDGRRALACLILMERVGKSLRYNLRIALLA